MSGFSSLNVGAQGLFAAQRALDVAGQNISNANTDGYSRQRVQQSARGGSVVPAMFSRSGADSGGVDILGTERIRDGFLEARAHQEHATNAGLGALSSTYADIEATFGEPSTTGLQSQLSSFWTSWSTVANDPGRLGPPQPPARAGQHPRRHGQRVQRAAGATVVGDPRPDHVDGRRRQLHDGGGRPPQRRRTQRDPRRGRAQRAGRPARPAGDPYRRGDRRGRQPRRRRRGQPDPGRPRAGHRGPQPAAAGGRPRELPRNDRDRRRELGRQQPAGRRSTVAPSPGCSRRSTPRSPGRSQTSTPSRRRWSAP